jgi:minor extracellular protease Epr
VGPPNLAVGAAVRAVEARGILIVAPVGNDGPAAPPAYPASYPGVVAVTGVDARGRVLIEAGRASHLDFAAPGAEVRAASLSGGFTSVRGTSFAAPVVAGRLALAEAAGAPDPAAAIAAVAAAARKGPGYGKGLVAAQVLTARGR